MSTVLTPERKAPWHLWVVGVAALAPLSRRSLAVWLFVLSLAAILITNAYEFAAGTSRAFVTPAALIVIVIIVLLAIFQTAYASAMKRRAVLK